MYLHNVNPNVKVIGRSLISILTNLEDQEIQDTLQNLNLPEIELDQWYPICIWQQIFDALEHQPTLFTRLVVIGIEFSQTLSFPDTNLSIQEFLRAWASFYHYSHRDGYVGHIQIQKVSHNYYHVIHPATYPQAFVYGLAYGLLRRFSHPDKHFVLQYHPHYPRMSDGSQHIHLLIKWDQD